MITRVFRATVPAELQGEFEEKFKEISVPLVRAQKGLHRVTIGRPTSSNPYEFVMISVWDDAEAIAEFVGEKWDQPHIPAGMEHLMTGCSVGHYENILPD